MTNEQRRERKLRIIARCRYYSEDYYGNLIPWIAAARIAIAEIRDEERQRAHP